MPGVRALGRPHWRSFMSRTSASLLAAASVVLVATARSHAEPIDPAQAGKYFKEMEAASQHDGSKLWGKPLYGPMFFAEPNSRFMVANQADGNGKLTHREDVYCGTLPAEIVIAN